jgi:uncharacterized protein (TIGR02145 family)
MTEADYLTGQSNNIYGALYQWDTMNTSTCLGTGILASNTTCPCKGGYHLPSQTEWDTLEMNLGCTGTNKITTFNATGVGWECMTTNTDTINGIGWNSTNPNSLKNKLGLSLAGNCISGSSCAFRGYGGLYWSSAIYTLSSNNSWGPNLYSGFASVYRAYTAQTYDFSVRCVKD